MTVPSLLGIPMGPIGMGCMNLSHAYGTPPPAGQAQRLLHRALDLGVTLLDTAALYGFGANEELLGTTLAGRRSQYLLASKCGMQGVRHADGVRRVIDGRPETIRATCEDSLRRLRTDCIDLYYLHRVDRAIPVEESVGAMAALLRAGKIRAIGLCEVSAATLRRAHAIHPICAVQSEYSLWTRNPQIAVLDACRQLQVVFVAFSPLARGFLTGALRDVAALEAKDIRRAMPRFAPHNYARNLELLGGIAAVASELDASLAQVALGWLLAQGPDVVPIPGTTREDHLAENLGAGRLRLSPEQFRRLAEAVPVDAICGERYNATTQAEIDTEEFPRSL